MARPGAPMKNSAAQAAMPIRGITILHAHALFRRASERPNRAENAIECYIDTVTIYEGP